MPQPDAVEIGEVVLIDPRAVHCPPDNPNDMDAETYVALREYIRAVGFDQPVTVTLDPDGNHEFIISDGHHRLRAGIELGMEFVPAIVKDWTEAERRRDRLAKNRLRGKLDLSKTTGELSFLVQEFDASELELTGFASDEILDLLDAASATTAEEVLRDTAPPPEEIEVIEDKTYNLNLKFTSEVDRARFREMLVDHANEGTLAAGAVNLIDVLHKLKTQPTVRKKR